MVIPVSTLTPQIPDHNMNYVPTFTKFTSLPCIQGTTEKIRRILNETGIKVAMKHIWTIGQYLPSPNVPITTEEFTCIVYKAQCKDCDLFMLARPNEI